MKLLSIFVFATSFLISSLSMAYTTMIKNSTESEIKVDITYGGAGACSPSSFAVKPRQTIGEDEKGCCTNTVKITAMSGNSRGKVVDYVPPSTGAGLSCKSWAAEVKPIGDRDEFIVVKYEPKEWGVGKVQYYEKE